MRVTYSAASKFKYITQTLAKINDEGDLIFTLEGMIAYIMSPDKTSLAVLRAPIVSFDEYDVSEEIAFRIRTDEFNKIVKRATRNDDLIIEYRADEQALQITLRDRKTGVPRIFLLPVIVLDQAEVREPKIEGKARFTMMTDDFKTMIQDAKVVGDRLELNAKEDEVIARVTEAEWEYEWIMKDGDPLLSLTVEEEATSAYTVSSLQVATKPTGAAESVKVEFDTNYPLKIEFSFPKAEKMYLYIAPSD